MPKVQANGIELYYELEGDEDGAPLLLIGGLGSQLIGWPEELRARLVAGGFRLILFDNRDAGYSTHFDESGLPDVIGLMMGGKPGPVPYLLADMADDAAGLIEALGLDAAHVLGVSMGGMIAQELVIRHPEKVLSLCSIMSRTGAPGVGLPSDRGLRAMLQPPGQTREDVIAMSIEGRRAIGSPVFGFDEELELRRAAAHYDRCYHPAGTARQLAAIISSPDRTEALGAVKSPTVVIHGSVDPLVQLDGGEGTAAAIPEAGFLIIEGMGHDLPHQVLDEVVAAVVANARAADGPAHEAAAEPAAR